MMLVSSVKVATTCEKPNFEIERTLLSPGRPPSDSSMGRVMSCSISSGERAGATVLTCTCTGVVSGKASMGRVQRA